MNSTLNSTRRFSECQQSTAPELIHDLQNLLHGIARQVGAVLGTIPEREPVWASLQDVRDACREAKNLCHVIHHDLCASPMQRLSLRELVEDMCPLLQREIPKTATFHWVPYPHPLWVAGNREKLKRALLILVENAAEALTDGIGSVTIHSGVTEPCELHPDPRSWRSSIRSEHYAYVEVLDSGCGMDEPVVQGLFERPYSTKGAGRGLGLLSVQDIVAEHHGRLELRSDPGCGTTVRMLFPYSTRANEADSDDCRGTDVPAPGHSMR